MALWLVHSNLRRIQHWYFYHGTNLRVAKWIALVTLRVPNWQISGSVVREQDPDVWEPGGPERLLCTDPQLLCSSWKGNADALEQRFHGPESVKLCIIVFSASQIDEDIANMFSTFRKAKEFFSIWGFNLSNRIKISIHFALFASGLYISNIEIRIGLVIFVI